MHRLVIGKCPTGPAGRASHCNNILQRIRQTGSPGHRQTEFARIAAVNPWPADFANRPPPFHAGRSNISVDCSGAGISDEQNRRSSQQSFGGSENPPTGRANKLTPAAMFPMTTVAPGEHDRDVHEQPNEIDGISRRATPQRTPLNLSAHPLPNNGGVHRAAANDSQLSNRSAPRLRVQRIVLWALLRDQTMARVTNLWGDRQHFGQTIEVNGRWNADYPRFCFRFLSVADSQSNSVIRMKRQVCCRYRFWVNDRGRLTVLHNDFVSTNRHCRWNECQNPKLNDKHEKDAGKREYQWPEVRQDDLRKRPFETSNDCGGHDCSAKCNTEKRRRIQDGI